MFQNTFFGELLKQGQFSSELIITKTSVTRGTATFSVTDGRGTATFEIKYLDEVELQEIRNMFKATVLNPDNKVDVILSVSSKRR